MRYSEVAIFTKAEDMHFKGHENNFSPIVRYSEVAIFTKAEDLHFKGHGNT